MTQVLTRKKLLLGAEALALFGAMPLALSYIYLSRWAIHGCLWVVVAYAFYILRKTPEFSWRALWEGKGWQKEQRRKAALRFCVLAPVLTIFTVYFAPDKLLQFPIQRPVLWAAVMALYPVLSAVPQEFVYRSFFFRRYGSLMTSETGTIVLSAFFFGFVHILFHNWVAPVFSGLGGLIFASSYAQHRSLKWAAIEHAIYGNFVFTLGLGWYFVHVPTG